MRMEYTGAGYYFNVFEEEDSAIAEYKIDVTLCQTTSPDHFVVDVDIVSGAFGDGCEYSEWHDDIHTLDAETAKTLALEAFNKFMKAKARRTA